MLVLVFSVFAEGASITVITDANSDNPVLTMDSVELAVLRGEAGAATFVCDKVQWLNLSGEPRIPWRVLTLLLPPDIDLNSISANVVGIQYESIAGIWDVSPSPPWLTWKDGQQIIVWPEDKIIVDGRDVDIYERDAFWPQPQARVLCTGQLRKYQMAQIAVPLVRYNPVSSKLLKLTEANVAVTFDRIAVTSTMSASVEQLDEIGKARVKKLALNFEEMISAYDTAAENSVNLMGMESGGIDPNVGYTIITTSAIEANSTKLADFVAHKESLNFDVQVITETNFGGGTGDAAAENIRSWLQSNYINDNIGYILLIGDPDPNNTYIPMKMLWPRYGFGDNEESPSDLYYADLTGNWDLDGDGYYGEWEDDFGTGGVDRFWEVFVGRIPYYGSISDLDAILQKTIDYETQIGDSEEWRKNVLLPMNPLSAQTPGYRLGEQIKYSILEPKGWISHRIYDEDYDLVPPPETTPCNKTNVCNVWSNNPFGLVVLMSHGSRTSAEDVIDTTYVPNLNDNHPSFTFQASCQNSWPERSDNLSYALLKNGGICTIGATRNSWYLIGGINYNNQEIDNMAFEYTSRLVGEGLDCGESLHDLRQVYNPLESEGWMNFTVFNIYGDPSLRIIRSEPPSHTPVTYYVDAVEGDNDVNGLSWDTAFKDLQDAFAVALNNDTILVAQGIYNPTVPNGNRGISFRPSYGVSIYGGFPTGGADWYDRNPEIYKTILSGDLNNNDVGDLDDPSRDENSYHVVIGSSDFTMDGFTITGGNANDLYNPVRSTGGGMILSHSSAILTNCIFTRNFATGGAGIDNCNYGWPTLINCTFTSNLSSSHGCAIYNLEANLTLTNCTFSLNSISGDGYGGAIFTGYGAYTLTNCTFTSNSAKHGGAINANYSVLTLTDCTFTSNSASSGNGGGIYYGESVSTLINCTFNNNSADQDGGGINLYWEESCAILTNCAFSGNSAKNGGGMYCYESKPTLVNCTFNGNWALWDGSGICLQGPQCIAALTNCIIWEDQLYTEWGTKAVTVTYSCIQGGWEGLGNIDNSPCFADTSNDDYHLKSEVGRWNPNSQSWVRDDVSSPCIDAGNPGCPVGDEPSPNGNRRNMGAYGGTAEASKSPAYWRSIADITNDWIVDSNDLKVFADYWLQMGECTPGDFDRNQFVNFNDFAILGGQWRQKGPGPGITYDIGGCIPVDFPSSAAEEPNETRFTVTVEGRNIYFEDMMRANCCPEELDVQMTVEGDLITIYEIERFFTRVPCPCLCDFPITATFGPFEPDTYILEVYQDGYLIGTTIVTIENG